ncbi:hypothetical protein [Parafrankia sp. EUN1f]|nr:hypothetical protein [Parafrankia sp. EUN1f]EFC80245.1 hypothetical protein FrEUN1fDRAFT_6639 [Parafrankia sp. EUN1f]
MDPFLAAFTSYWPRGGDELEPTRGSLAAAVSRRGGLAVTVV